MRRVGRYVGRSEIHWGEGLRIQYVSPILLCVQKVEEVDIVRVQRVPAQIQPPPVGEVYQVDEFVGDGAAVDGSEEKICLIPG